MRLPELEIAKVVLPLNTADPRRTGTEQDPIPPFPSEILPEEFQDSVRCRIAKTL